MYRNANGGKKQIWAVMLLLAGAILFPMAWGQAFDIPQELVVAYPSKLISFTWDSSGNSYTKSVEIPLEPAGYHQLASLQGSVYVSTDNAILKYDSALKQVSSKGFKDVMAMASDGECLFLCAEGALFALDTDLSEFDRVPLVVGENGETKNAHDIVVYKKTAYLLDNILHPIYLFRIDITYPEVLKVASRVNHQGINTHLVRQWVDPERDEWYVVESTSVMTGYGESLVVFPLSSGTKCKDYQQLWFKERGMPEERNLKDKEESKPGLSILATTLTPPLVALTQYKDTQTQLATIKHKGNGIIFEPIVELPDFKAPLAILARSQDCLVISESQPKYGRYVDPPAPSLCVVKTSNPGEVIHRQPLDLIDNALPCDILILDK